jgi:succinoglycan biosynthesis protein ExoM
MAPDVSVCVASYQRPRGLARLLESLVRQKLPSGLDIELIVVDNDAEGSAAPVLARYRDALPLRSFLEPRRNIAHARNRALAEARGRWLAFVDDDEEAEEGWLAAYWSRLEGGEDADGWFGPVLPRTEEPHDGWLELERFYARPQHAPGCVLGLADLTTSNAFVRRSLFQVRRFDPGFGRSGGEDTEIFGRLLRAGSRFRCCDDARVVEYLPAERLRLGWLAQRAFRGGAVTTRLERLRLGRGSALVRRGPQALAGLALYGASLPLAALGGRVPAARAALGACTQAGHLWAMLGGVYEEYRA